MALKFRSFVCEECGTSFSARRKAQRFCCARCFGIFNTRDMKLRGVMSSGTECSQEECERRSHSMGLCLKHWKRWKRHGSTDTIHPRRPREMSVHDWFLTKIEKDTNTECWNWVGKIAHKRGGYGIFYDANKGKNTRAHHFLVPPLPSREEANGAKMEYDHACSNPRCVNPDHLQMVTASENRMRQHRRSTR